MQKMVLAFGVMTGMAASSVAQPLIGVNGGSGGGFSAPGAVVRIDADSGAATVLGTPTDVGLAGVAVDNSGRVFAVTGNAFTTSDGPHLLEVDPQTGALIADIGRLQTAGGSDCFVGDLSFQPSTGVLFGVLVNRGTIPRCGIGNTVAGYLVTIDVDTAEVTVIGRDASIGNNFGGIAFARDGDLFFTPCWDDPGALLRLDPSDASVVASTALQQPDTCYQGLGVRFTDNAIFASFDENNNDNNIYILDPVTGVRELVGDPGNFLIHDLAFLLQAEPAPTASAVGVIALIGGLLAAAASRLKIPRA